MSEETGIPIPFDANSLACGYDRLDGITIKMGTKTPANAIKASSAAGNVGDFNPADMPIEEEPDSPVVENAEQQTITHRFHGGANEVFSKLHALHRGIIRTDSSGDLFKLLSATAHRMTADHASLHTVEEQMSGDTPPDQFECIPVDLGITLIKHPRYYSSLEGNDYVIRLLQNYFENATAAYRDALYWMLLESFGTDAGSGDVQPPQWDSSKFNATDPSAAWQSGALIAGSDMAKAAAVEILTKFWRGEETPSLTAFQIVWTEFFWWPFYFNPGGYTVEDPSQDPLNPLPQFLWDTTFPPSGTFDTTGMFALVGAINPQNYSADGTAAGVQQISWRREPDVPVRDRTFWAWQHKWTGSAIGQWDQNLYTNGPRPQVPEDYDLPADALVALG